MQRKRGPGHIKQDWLLREDDLRELQRELNRTDEWFEKNGVIVVGKDDYIQCTSTRTAQLVALLRNSVVLLLNDNLTLRRKYESLKKALFDLIKRKVKHDDK